MPDLSKHATRLVIRLSISGMTCASCSSRLERVLNQLPGVEAQVNLATEKARVHYQPGLIDEDGLIAAVARAGFTATPASEEQRAQEKASKAAEYRHEMRVFVFSALLTLPLLLEMVAMIGSEHGQPFLPGWAQWLLATPVQFWAGWRFYDGAWKSLRGGGANMDVLVALGTSAAYFFSLVTLFMIPGGHLYFEASAAVVTLVRLGKLLEVRAKSRTSTAIEQLIGLQPRSARVERNGQFVDADIADIHSGDRVQVRAGERIPVDGRVEDGRSGVDESLLTGESLPVAKTAGARVIAGAQNLDGMLVIRAEGVGSQTQLMEIVRLTEAAQGSKAPIQKLADRISGIFVPAVIGLALLALVGWWLVTGSFGQGLIPAVAVLVIACPCALGLATPTAVMVGLGRGAQLGILVRAAEVLERAEKVTVLALDKTGTLTEGRPRITDVLPVRGTTEADLLAIAVAVERLSDHPLADAIARDGSERLGDIALVAATDLKSLTGKGVTAQLGGETIWIGKPEMFGADGVAGLDDETTAVVSKLREQGRTLMVVRRGSRDLGVIGLLDTPRAAAGAALAALRALGVQRLIMISGDHQKAAQAIAEQVGLTEAWGDLMPEDKVDAIKKLRADGKIAMVGDGVNDAPAMATAIVGIAMGAAGSDVALETADVALMSDDLAQLPFTVGLSRQTRRIILQNLYVSLGVVAFLVPATILGLGIGPAVALHEGSTLLVVFNALRLLGYRDRTAPTLSTAIPAAPVVARGLSRTSS